MSKTSRSTFFKTQKEVNAQNINRSIEKNLVNRLYDNEKNKFTSKNRYLIFTLNVFIFRDFGFLTDLTGIMKHNLPKISSPTRTAKNKKMPIDYSQFFKCSTIKNNEQFFEQIFIPLIMNNEITILFDEAHALPKDLTMAFLTIFNTEKTNTKDFTFEDQTFTFDFSRQTFIFATTESDKLFPPLKDRLTTVDFEQYSQSNLGEILKLNCDGINFSDEALNALSSTVRGNARNAVMRSREVVLYCESENKNDFNLPDFEVLVDLLGILPEGITCTEKQILDILADRGSCKLQTLSAVTGLSPTSLRRDHEVYLLRKNFMQIDGERKITNFGKNLLLSI